MKRNPLLLWLWLLLLIGMACSFPTLQRLFPPTPTPTPAPTATPSPTPTPTPWPTPLPTAQDPLAKGQRLLFYGDWDAALSAFQEGFAQAVNDPKTQARALVGQGRALYGARRYAEAIATLRQVGVAFPEETDARADAAFFLALIYTDLERWDEAATAYADYLRWRPGLIDAYIHEFRGDVLFNAQRYAEALAAYQAALEAPHAPEREYGLYLGIARAYHEMGQYAEAIQRYRQLALRENAAYRLAYLDYLIGQAYLEQGDPTAAYDAFRHAVEHYPTAYSAYLALVALVEAEQPVDDYQRGLVDYYAGQYGAAVEAFQRYLKAHADAPNPRAYYFQGLALRALGRAEEALSAWQPLRENHPDAEVWDEAWEQTAYTLWAWLERYGEATQTLLAFVERAPNHPRAAEFLYDAALIQERAGRIEQALALLQRTALNYPGTPYAYQALMRAGLLHYREGRPQQALKAFRHAAEYTASPAEVAATALWRGKALAALGDEQAARSAWELAAAADPTGYYSERARDLLVGRPPFAPPGSYDLGVAWEQERAEAATWLRNTFALPAGQDPLDLAPLLADPRALRAAELWRLGRYPEARDEIEAMRQSFADDPAQLFRLITFCLDLGAYRPAVFAARRILDLAGFTDFTSLTAPPYFSHVRFGPYFAELVVPLGQTYALHPLLLFAVMRQESLFEPFIASTANARGLMQILPSTGEEIATQLGWPPNFIPADLDAPKVSLTFGAYYLARQRDYLDGDLYAALAAYNGGLGNALRWHEQAGDDPDLFLESVRFAQTRDYIRRVYEVFVIYRNLYTRGP